WHTVCLFSTKSQSWVCEQLLGGSTMRTSLPACALALVVGVATAGAVSAWWPCAPPVPMQFQTITCYRTEYRVEYRDVERTVFRCVPEGKQQKITETVLNPFWKEAN